jgi:spermidine dehydrogenase
VSQGKRDRELGMHRNIARRDFLNGVGVAVGASLLVPNSILGEMLNAADAPFSPEKQPGYYPPAKTGLRGSHDGSWEVGHALRDGKKWDQAVKDKDTYDLIIVGGGISGLAAAYFYRQQAGNRARILILDNHDDFGGHAKRNEFTTGGKQLIGYGGTQAIAGPNLYSAQAKQLLKDLGIEVKRFETYNDRKFYSQRGMGQAVFFDKETFGADRLVRGYNGHLQVPSTGFLVNAPLSDAAKKDLVRLCREKVDYLAGMDAAAKKAYLAKTSYQDYLLKNVKVTPDLIPYFKPSMHGPRWAGNRIGGYAAGQRAVHLPLSGRQCFDCAAPRSFACARDRCGQHHGGCGPDKIRLCETGPEGRAGAHPSELNGGPRAKSRRRCAL